MVALFHRTSESPSQVAFLRQCLQEVRNLRSDEITFSSDSASAAALGPDVSGADAPVAGTGVHGRADSIEGDLPALDATPPAST
jgi:hypothetical protein